MSSFDEKRRNVKRPYRKKSLQTGMSVIDKSVDATPLPPASYDTTTHQATTPVRRGIDPHIYQKDIRPAVESLDFARPLDLSRYPWHLAPKGDSANVISRIAYNFDATTGGTNVADDEYLDILVLNLFGTGSQEPGPSTIGTSYAGPPPVPAYISVNTATGSDTTSGNPDFPQAGNTTVGASGTVRQGSPGEIYKISSFGHSTLTGAVNWSPGIANPNSTNPIVYQIYVDGSLFMEWDNFQWSPVTPLRSQWEFSQPLTVTEQIVFRMINKSGATINAGEIEVCFNGWSEQFAGYTDVSYQQLES